MRRRPRRVIASIVVVGVACWALATFVVFAPAATRRAVLVSSDTPPIPDIPCVQLYAVGAITPTLAHSSCGDGDASIAIGEGVACRNGTTMIFGNSRPYGTGFYGISGQPEHIYHGSSDPDFRRTLKSCIGNEAPPVVPNLRAAPAVTGPPTPCRQAQLLVGNGPPKFSGVPMVNPPGAYTGIPGPGNTGYDHGGLILQIWVTNTATTACTLNGFPRVELIAGTSQTVETHECPGPAWCTRFESSSGPTGYSAVPGNLTLGANLGATAFLMWLSQGLPSDPTCPSATGVSVTLPGIAHSFTVTWPTPFAPQSFHSPNDPRTPPYRCGVLVITHGPSAPPT